jgi:hypothetical protein
MSELPAEERAVLQPGDILILRYARITAQDADWVKKRLAADMPGVRVVIIQADGMAVQRKENT